MFHRLIAVFAATLCLMFATSVLADVKVDKVAYFNQPNCYKFSNGVVEVIMTTDIGPRVIRYSFPGEDNMFAEIPDTKVKTEFGEWRPWGGHRLWHAPEGIPRSYWPDNSPVKYKLEGANAIRLSQDVEAKTGIEKEMLVSLAAEGTAVTVTMKLTNRGYWPIEMAPWGMTIMNGGGYSILPQEPYISHDDKIDAARPMVIWHYTNLMDPRWTIGKKYIRLKTDEKNLESQKVGILNKQGWAGYYRGKTLFVKNFPYVEKAQYPDYNCNNETYTAGTFMELETLGPLAHLEPGQSTEYSEVWHLFKNVDLGDTEATLDAAITPLIEQSKK